MAKHIERVPNVDIEIEHWPIERLIPRANNPRTHTREQVARIAASIREFGFTNPILVVAEDDIIAGHAGLLAAEKLAMKEVPVIVLSHLSPTGLTRVSLETRTVSIADVRAGRGAPNVDSRGRWAAPGMFRRLSDSRALHELLVASLS